ncbi:hypothetical protein BU17DRAFT_80721 [Hysterangium stoloniferum]|nr:hypothetical protein BU17DRAFT_80721 [Hysterangium stoloniferum]
MILRAGGIPIAFQVIYLGLSLHILFRRARAFRLLTRMTPMLKIFFRDGAMYCLIICVMYVVNILTVTYGGNSPLQGLGEIWLAPVVSISAGRLVLNLRGSLTSSDTSDDDGIDNIIFVLLSEGAGTTAVLPNPLPGVFPGCYPATHFNTTMTLRAGGITITFHGKILIFYAYKERLTAFEAIYLGLSVLSPSVAFYREELTATQGRRHILCDYMCYVSRQHLYYQIWTYFAIAGTRNNMVASRRKHLGWPFGAEPTGKLDHVRS